MQVVGRDQPDQELTLEFSQERCVWELTKAARPPVHREPEPLIQKIAAFMTDKETWTGTASELLEAIPDLGIRANALTRKLNVSVSVLYNDFGIRYLVNPRSRDRKTFTLVKETSSEETPPEPTPGDDVTANDDEIPCAPDRSYRHDGYHSDGTTL